MYVNEDVEHNMSDDDVSMLTGLTLVNITVSDDEIVFTDSDGRAYKMWHGQDCCESVTIEDITGEINDLLYTPILFAESVSNSDNLNERKSSYDESFTWTFYKFSTIKGSVTIRWYGTSNGYYSESVSFRKISNDF